MALVCGNGPTPEEITATLAADVTGGMWPDDDVNTIAARISNRDAIDAKLKGWQDSELGIYDLEAVRELGHNVI